MGYAVDLAEPLRRWPMTCTNLKGANSGGYPDYQPTKFELLINLKTGKPLALTLPPALLARDDR